MTELDYSLEAFIVQLNLQNLIFLVPNRNTREYEYNSNAPVIGYIKLVNN